MSKPMKKLFAACALLTALAAGGGCADDPAEESEGQGRIEFALSTSGDVPTADQPVRAEARRTLPASCVPIEGHFSLRITDAQDTELHYYPTREEYDTPLLERGAYHGYFAYGNPEAEGPTAYYYEGSVDFTVVARKTTVVPATAALANAAVSLETTEWFDNYYTTANLKIRTESGYERTFTVNKGAGLRPNPAVPFFVKPDTRLFLSGTALKTNGVEVAFTETEIGRSRARYWHSVKVDMSQSAQLTLHVTLDDEPTEIKETIVELNPDA